MVWVGGQPGSHGLLWEGWGTSHSEPQRSPERREGGGTGLEGETGDRREEGIKERGIETDVVI